MNASGMTHPQNDFDQGVKHQLPKLDWWFGFWSVIHLWHPLTFISREFQPANFQMWPGNILIINPKPSTPLDAEWAGGNEHLSVLVPQSQNHQLAISWNGGTPKSPISMGFSLINHPFWGTSIYGSPQLKPLSHHMAHASPQQQLWTKDAHHSLNRQRYSINITTRSNVSCQAFPDSCWGYGIQDTW